LASRELQCAHSFAFTLSADGTPAVAADQTSYREQASMIWLTSIIWRDRNVCDQALRDYVKRANVA
jgi:hypothetical protein